MNKCFTCKYLKSNADKWSFTCVMDCIDCKYEGSDKEFEPCNSCTFCNCKFKEKEGK